MAAAQPLTVEEQQRSRIPEIRNPAAIVSDYSVTSIGRILTDMQLQWQVESLDSGTQVVAVNVYGLQVLIAPGKCTRGGNPSCTDIQLMSIFEFDEQPISPVIATRFNNSYSFGYVGLSSGNGVFLRRYDFEETGFMRSHLRHSILSFRGFAQDFFQVFNLTLSDADDAGPDPAEPPVGLQPGSPAPSQKGPDVGAYSFALNADANDDVSRMVDELKKRARLVNRVR